MLLAATLLAGCTSSSSDDEDNASKGNDNAGRYALKYDAPPDDANLDPNDIPDAVPIIEPRKKAGNKSPYTVLGETYQIMSDSAGYTDTGKASWYGKKFNGYKTSNGEIFDMYKMSAAHRTLPIPCYVRVTNLANGRSGVVRVNDRGPFHSDRIMDLSYAAAVKLDMLRTGTALVKIEVIDPSTNAYAGAASEAEKDHLERPVKKSVASKTKSQSTASTASKSPATGTPYLQAGAFHNQSSALALRDKLVSLTGKPVKIDNAQGLFKVRIGPLADPNEIQNISDLMVQNNFNKPQVVHF
jgi:rare lipoprotein A